jgi:Ca2+-binding RTX toxin-like protein
MATYVYRSYYSSWMGGVGDQAALRISGAPGRYKVNWGDGSGEQYRYNADQSGDGVADYTIATHRYAQDGVYNVAVWQVPANDVPPRLLRAHVHAHADEGRTVRGNDLDEMFLMGEHDDVVRTGNGYNWVAAGGGDDVVIGGYQTDTIDGGAGDDVLRGGAGGETDYLFGNDGNDVLRGEGGYDQLYGGDGDDRLDANIDGDALYGGAGRDRLLGDRGNDRLEGGAGADILTGGAGGDFFGVGPDETGRDVITDFGNDHSGARDRIDLRGWESAFGFKFLGTGGFTGAGEEVRFAQVGDRTVVFGDVDGDKLADFSIALLGQHTLTAADFIL